MRDLLLITPPFTQLNTPYPATAYLKGFLNTKGITAFQMDLGIEVINILFSQDGLISLFETAEALSIFESNNAYRIFQLQDEYIDCIDEVILFLQGQNQTLARQICAETFLPQASRFDQVDDMEWAFGNMGMQDKAKHLATLFLEDLADFIKEAVDPNFGFSRYAERLGMSANTFDDLYDQLNGSETFIDQLTLPVLQQKIQEHQPKLICFSVPFPGNLYSAFKCAQYIKKHYPSIKTAMGGGFPNTELRSLKDARVMEFFDFITLDDGELPIEMLVSNILDPSINNPNHKFFKRTFLLEDGKIEYNNFSLRKDYAQSELGTPDYSDLLLGQYISVIEIANPMHSLWSDGRWNKLTMAHGCYWGKCTFCDISLDYIKNYEPVAATLLVDRMEEIIEQTGERGFHFVDEAAPPALMRSLAIEILRRKLKVSWWTNIRFEKSFSHDLCRLLLASGCIAVSGGLEVASDRLLDLIKKGVTVEQVARVSKYFTESGIMVHAYLMYGYPTQTEQETIDSLEMVRQLFEAGVLQSGFWHQFAMTTHSPVGMNAEDYGVIAHKQEVLFADNDIAFTDSTGIDHGQFSQGLKKSLFNYMHGVCFDYDLQDWFDQKIPKTSIASHFIQDSLERPDDLGIKGSNKVLWIGGGAEWLEGKEVDRLVFHSKTSSLELDVDAALSEWLLNMLNELSIQEGPIKTYAFIKASFEEEFEDFTLFWYSELMQDLRNFALLVL